MNNPDTEDRTKHLQAVLDELPEHYRKHSDMRGTYLRIHAGAEVRLEKSERWRSLYDRLKIDLDYSVKKDLNDRVKNRSYKRREKGTAFAYKRAAEFIVKTLDARAAVLKRRELGEAKARNIGDRMRALFKSDPMLGGLGLDVISEPVFNTEIGETRVFFVDGSGPYDDTIELITTGNKFRGEIKVSGLTAEQVIALVTILKADKLSLLDMLTLADDSILGPIIRKLTEDDSMNDDASE